MKKRIRLFTSILHCVFYLNLLKAYSEGSLQNQYIGCYYDSSSQSNWTTVLLNSSAMTIESCIQMCKENTTTTYAILQVGRNCLCGDVINASVPYNECQTPCSGSGNEVCGGVRETMVFSVIYTVCPIGYYGVGCDQVCHCKQHIPCYRFSGECPNGCESSWTGNSCSQEANVSGRYIGCYRDNYNPRAMTFYGLYLGANTIEFCSAICSSNYSTYLGLQYQSECFCGESYDKYDTTMICIEKCSGNQAQICGGNLANSVYSVCPKGTYGRDCIAQCNCRDSRICPYRTGSCNSQCKSGWSGDICNNRVCSSHNGDCSANETCVTTNLKFSSVSRCHCTHGYQRTRLWDDCVDVDECTLGLCDSQTTKTCNNTVGDFICNCLNGYAHVNKTFCEDINECSITPGVCNSALKICENTVGSYKCKCIPGYVIDNNDTCIDVDECALPIHTCDSETQRCNNTIGSYVCTCKNGFQMMNESTINKCEDINECLSSPCDNSTICTNTRGSFICNCKPGFTRSDYNSVCEDVDECALPIRTCDSEIQHCNNTVGSYVCTCKYGFQMINDSTVQKCEDINECLSFPCDNSTICTNTRGNFICICKPGFTRSDYNSVCEEAGNGNAGAVAGAVVGSVLGLALIVAIVFLVLYLFRRRQPEKLVNHNPELDEVPCSSQENLLRGRAMSLYAECPYEEIRPTTGSALNTVQKKLGDPDSLKKEFESVNLKAKNFCAIGTRDEVKKKNRFINIIPYESNRVILSRTTDEDTSQYINASYVQGYKNRTKFIAAQGPREETLEDFWRMIIENRVHLIVMITNLVENRKNKCEQYWPESGHPVVYGDITVTLKSEDSWPDYTVRCIQCSQNSKTIELTHFHYLSWPDHGVPSDIKGFLTFRRIVRQRMKPDQYTLVHCSAGAGRTGTFIAIDYLLEQEKVEQDVKILDCLKELREQRSHMIQNLAQYVFVHDALLLAFEIGDTVIPTAQFLSKYTQFQNKDATSVKSTLEKQFQFLEQVNVDPEEAGKYRLWSNVVAHEKMNAMNALFVQSWKLKDAYISLQPADPFTNIWELCREQSCFVMIFLDPTRGSVNSFIPTKNNPIMLNDCTLVCESKTKEEYGSRCTLTEFKAQEEGTYANVSSSDVYQNTGSTSAKAQITVLHVTEFLGKSSGDVSRLLSLYTVVNSLTSKKNDVPVMVISSDLSLSGFCLAAFNAFEMIKQEQMIDLYQIVLNIRKSKPELFNSLSSYIDLHNVVEQYILMSTT